MSGEGLNQAIPAGSWRRGGLWVGVVLEYHGGLGEMGIKNAMVDGVRRLEVT